MLVHTHSGRGARVEGTVTKSPKEGGLADTRIPHQDNLEEAVRWRETTFLLRRDISWWQGLKEDDGISLKTTNSEHPLDTSTLGQFCPFVN